MRTTTWSVVPGRFSRVPPESTTRSPGAASPLTGFMAQADYQSVVQNMRLANGLPWSIPVTLAVTPEQASALTPGSQAALTDEAGNILAVLTVQETYRYDKQVEAEKVYRTTEEAHPGVAALYDQPDVLVGGSPTRLTRPSPCRRGRGVTSTPTVGTAISSTAAAPSGCACNSPCRTPR